MNLWLDDVRPAPAGWTHVRTVPEAKAAITSGEVEQASLDHDLGLCDDCFTAAQKAVENGDSDAVLDVKNKMAWSHGLASYASCTHNGTGYDLVLWMAETGTWPKQRPVVHSLNSVGRDRMRGVIARYYPGVAETD